MPRKRRVLTDKGIYVIHNKGIENKNIFKDNQCKIKYISELQDVCIRYRFDCLAFLFLKNENYIVIKDNFNHLQNGIKLLNSGFTKKYHKLNKSKGKIFYDRFKSTVVQKEYLLDVVCSIWEQIPSKEIDNYKWSSFYFYMLQKKLPFLKEDILEELTQKNEQEIINTFKEKDFNKIQLNKDIIGDKSFVETVENCEVHRIKKADLKSIFEIAQNKEQRNKLIYIAHVEYGYEFKEIADYLELHPSTVSKIFASL